MPTPEQLARENIDAALEAAGWSVQFRTDANIHAALGVAIREFTLDKGYGHADYLLYVNGQAAGAVEAKPEGTTLTGVEIQTGKYSDGLPIYLPAWVRPLPFLYESTGVETRFTNRLDPVPRSRNVFSFHQPATLAAWLDPALARIQREASIQAAVAQDRNPYGSEVPASFRNLLQNLPSVDDSRLWPAQLQAIQNLEKSLANDRPRALIQMTMGSGKTFTSVSAIYRLINHASARRVLFLVDRLNLGRQAKAEFDGYATPDDGRKFTELYNVQLLTSHHIDPAARVVIATIQRLYAMLTGEELEEEADEASAFESMSTLTPPPAPVAYNPAIPVETFDLLFTDECHRSIYNLWSQVLEYFDASIVGLTATPSKQTLGFFNQNLVMEYGYEQAVADKVNVDHQVYQIRTRITAAGSTVDAGYWVGFRDRATRARRWEQLDEDFIYAANVLDRSVVAVDQIRTVIQTFKAKLPEIFPDRSEVPKTLIYAKDDSHADDIVQIVREEFGKGNEFAQKITYRSGTARVVNKVTNADGIEVEHVTYKSSGVKPEDLLAAFRNSYYPRIVVTVDMLATGTDIRPLEIVMFMRDVKSRIFYEQMKGRGVRIIGKDDLQRVTPDAESKDHFVIVDCVGVAENDLADSQPLERQPTVSFNKLMDAVKFGSTDPKILSSMASRLGRLDHRISSADREALAVTAGGQTLQDIVAAIVSSLDPDRQVEAARAAAGLPPEAEPAPEQIAEARRDLLKAAVAPIAHSPELRAHIEALRHELEQAFDTVSKDEVLIAGFSEEARDKARALVTSFEQFLADYRDEITALQVLYSRPYQQRLRFSDIKALAQTIEAPPRRWTADQLWRAYEALERSKVRGSAPHVLTDIVALIRFALQQEPELAPFPEQVAGHYEGWLAMQEIAGREFTAEQREWLGMIRDHVAASFSIEVEDLDLSPFSQHGGAGRAYQVFGADLRPLLDELSGALVA